MNYGVNVECVKSRYSLFLPNLTSMYHHAVQNSPTHQQYTVEIAFQLLLKDGIRTCDLKVSSGLNGHVNEDALDQRSFRGSDASERSVGGLSLLKRTGGDLAEVQGLGQQLGLEDLIGGGEMHHAVTHRDQGSEENIEDGRVGVAGGHGRGDVQELWRAEGVRS